MSGPNSKSAAPTHTPTAAIRFTRQLPTLLLALSGALVGCTSDGGSAGDSPTTAPVAPAAAAASTGQESLAAWVDKVVTCLRDHGWQAERSLEGTSGVGLEIAPVNGQETALERDRQACVQAAGPRPPREAETAETFGKAYDALLVSANCLTRLGIAVDEPPARQTYVAQMLSHEEDMWSPYAHVPDDQWDTIEQKCPQP